MNHLPVLNFLDFISADGDLLTTDTMKVAQVHKKRHDNVMALVRKRIAEAGDWGLLNFKEIAYTDAGGRSYPMFAMTKDGYQFLVGKMSGAKAVQHQIAFIEAFNAMAQYLRNQRDGLRYRCMEKELECRDSARRGSFHGKGLNQRKQEKPVLESQLAALLAEAQPSLSLH
jgi:Rha family phage regulatory protein